VELSKDALMSRKGENLAQVWTDLFLKRDNKKVRKFNHIVEGNYVDFFEPLQFGVETDKITG
jgi:hypothetical protein